MYRTRIRESYEDLSKSQKRIADYLMTSHRDAAFMTASRMAKVIDVDVATITRFAQRLGYPGYPELLEEVRSVVQAEMSQGLPPGEGVSEAGRTFMRALGRERDNLERTMSIISMEAVDKAITALHKATRVFIVGMHTATQLSVELAVRLDMLGISARAVGGDAVQMALALRDVQAGDVVIGFGFSGYAAEVGGVFRSARERGATTVGISGSDVSPVARHADIALICVATSPLHIPSETSAIAIIEGLWQALAPSRMDIFQKNMQAFGDQYRYLSSSHSHPAGTADESIMKLY
jgi:DNA-binding MurR/RpiR family transcriptional regulator